jgi:hypothetical protein
MKISFFKALLILTLATTKMAYSSALAEVSADEFFLESIALLHNIATEQLNLAKAMQDLNNQCKSPFLMLEYGNALDTEWNITISNLNSHFITHYTMSPDERQELISTVLLKVSEKTNS